MTQSMVTLGIDFIDVVGLGVYLREVLFKVKIRISKLL